MPPEPEAQQIKCRARSSPERRSLWGSKTLPLVLAWAFKRPARDLPSGVQPRDWARRRAINGSCGAVCRAKLDLFEQHIPDLEVATGVSQARLQEIVAVARTAIDKTSPRVPGQHVVSKVLLRQFAVPTNGGERLLAHSLRYGKTKLRGPSGVGKLENFVKIDSQETEHLRGQTEQYLPAALAVAKTRRIFASPRHVGVIKDAIALHFARSLELLRAHAMLWEHGLERTRRQYRADENTMATLFYQKYGLLPPSARAASELNGLALGLDVIS